MNIIKGKSYSTCYLIVLVTLLFTGNACAQNLPVWVSNPGDVYDENKYMFAVGSGSTLSEARTDAMTNLSQIFQSNIEGTQQLYTEFIETQRNNDEFTSESTSRLLNNVKIGTKQELMNTTILETKVTSDGTYFALAGMDRQESSRIYEQELSGNRLKIENYLKAAEESDYVLSKMASLKQALTLARINENLAQQLSIIRSGMANSAMEAQLVSDVEERFRMVRQDAIVQISTNVESQTLLTAISTVLQNEGFVISDSPSESILEVKMNYQSQEANLNRPDAKFILWEIAIEVIDKDSNRSFKTFSTQGRDGAVTYSDALKRSELTAKAQIERDFKQFLRQQLLAQN